MTACPAFLSGSLGPAEVLLLFLAILVLFGPRRLPEIARLIGKATDRMRRASQEFRDQVMDIEKEIMSETPPPESPPLETGRAREAAGPEEEAPEGRHDGTLAG